MSVHVRTVLDASTATPESEDGYNAAELIVWQLEDLSRPPPEDCRVALQQGRELLSRLRGACHGRPALWAIFLRGKVAMESLLDICRDTMRARKIELERQSSERLAAIIQRNSHCLHVASQKERIIAILEAASRTTDPGSFAPHVRKCKEIWLGLGSAGHDDRRLAHAYRDSAAAYWRTLKFAAARSAATRGSTERKNGLVGALENYLRAT